MCGFLLWGYLCVSLLCPCVLSWLHMLVVAHVCVVSLGRFRAASMRCVNVACVCRRPVSVPIPQCKSVRFSLILSFSLVVAVTFPLPVSVRLFLWMYQCVVDWLHQFDFNQLNRCFVPWPCLCVFHGCLYALCLACVFAFCLSRVLCVCP